MYTVDFDTVIISDVHLGSDISRAEEAAALLKFFCYRRLVLLGDIFSDLNFRRLKKPHWHFLSCIRKLSNPKRGVEVVWVEGNHDEGLSELMSHLVGVPVYREYAWEFGGLRHLAIHGHQFDRFAVRNALLSRVGERLFSHLQKLDRRDKRLARYLDRLNTRWLRLTDKVERGALRYARQNGIDRIFCGHTHVAAEAVRDGIQYCNAGSWVDSRCSFIGINEEGAAIYEYDSRTFHRDSGQEREPAAAAVAGIDRAAGL